METLNLYQNNVAYDFDMFAPKPKKDDAPVIEYPGRLTREKVNAERKAREKKAKISRVIIVGVLLAAVVANIFSFAEISRVDVKIGKQKKIISKLDSEIIRLECNVQSLMTYDTIEESAKAIGMQKLERSQIVYISVNGTDFSEPTNADYVLPAAE